MTADTRCFRAAGSTSSPFKGSTASGFGVGVAGGCGVAAGIGRCAQPAAANAIAIAATTLAAARERGTLETQVGGRPRLDDRASDVHEAPLVAMGHDPGHLVEFAPRRLIDFAFLRLMFAALIAHEEEMHDLTVLHVAAVKP